MLMVIGPLAAISTALMSAPCAFTTFEEQSSFTRHYYSKEEFDAARAATTIDCLKIHYLSDGLKVVGYLVKPHDNARHPAIVYNRGGFLDIGKLDPSNLLDFFQLASKGFIVLASQYRGNDGGEGREELGGADVNDVINLRNLAAALPYVDSKNIFLYGLSRGGMMTFLALRRGVTVNAAAVVGAVIDLEDTLTVMRQHSPRMADAITSLIPDFSSRGVITLRERSAINWPEAISVPLLVLHGTKDEEVPVSEARAFDSKLTALKKSHEVVLYENDIHEVVIHRHERDQRVVSWFEGHMSK